MKNPIALKVIASCFVLTGASAAFSHVVLDEPTAPAGRGYKASLRISHGCEGSPTTGVKVIIPAGFQGAKPLPKAGWTLSTVTSKLDKPYDSHGKRIIEDVTDITWSANGQESWLLDAWFDEFVLRGNLPAQAGPMWFKVLQTCAKGSLSWTDVPAVGLSTKGLKSPAALLEIVESAAVGHQH